MGNKNKNVPNFSMEYHMLYVESRNSFEVRIDFFITLPCAKFLSFVFFVAHDKVALCRVPDRKHTAKSRFLVVHATHFC